MEDQAEYKEETNRVEKLNPENDSNGIDQHPTPLQSTGSKDPDQYDLSHQLARRWMATRHGTRWCDDTVTAYQSSARLFMTFLKEKETDILSADPNDILEFIEFRVGLGSAWETVSQDYRAIHDLYKFIRVRTDAEPAIDPYVFEEIDLSKYNYQGGFNRKAIKADEVLLLFENFKHRRNRLMAYFAVGTGVRNSDIRTLRCSDVDYDIRIINITNPKNGNPYEVPISRELANKLNRWQKSKGRKGYLSSRASEYMFPSQQGRYIKTGEGFNKWVKEAAERAGIQKVIGESTSVNTRDLRDRHRKEVHRVTVHTLRHTYITLLQKAGVPPEARELMANHKSRQTTKIYEHYDKNWHDVVRTMLPF